MAISSQGGGEFSGSLSVNGNTVYHSGNLSAATLGALTVSAAASTYLPISGGSIKGKLVVNPSYDTSSNSYNEGIRVNQASNGWAEVTLGGAANSTSGTGSTVWVIGRRGAAGTYGAVGDLTIECNDSSGSGLTLQAASGGQAYWKGNLIYHSGNLSKSTLGLGNVNNTADANKSVAYATNAGNADTLDGKHASEFATSGHTHSYLPLSGGTMTGTITLNNCYITDRLLSTNVTSGEYNRDTVGYSVRGYLTRKNIVGIDSSSPGGYLIAANWTSSSYSTELFLGMGDSNYAYLRGINGGTYTEWKRLAFASEIPSLSGYATQSWTNSNFATSGHTHDGRYLRWNGNAADTNAMGWGTLTSGNGYSILSHASSSDGGDVGLCYKGGQIFMQLDGWFYQNEGRYRCLDTSDSSSFAAASHTHSQYLTGITSSMVTSALGYTPYNAANISSASVAYASNAGMVGGYSASSFFRSRGLFAGGNGKYLRIEKVGQYQSDFYFLSVYCYGNIATYLFEWNNTYVQQAKLTKLSGSVAIQLKYSASDSAFYFTTGADYRIIVSGGYYAAGISIVNSAPSDIVNCVNSVLAFTSDIPTNNNQLTNGAGYITSSGSCTYATSAGNADTVDGYHYNNLPYLPLSGGALSGNLTLTNNYIWIQGGSAAGGNSNRLTTSSGMPENMQYNTSRRGTQIYSNGIAFCDPYNGNSNNDSGWIRHIETTTNNGVFEIAAGDDASNEEIRFRYYNTSNTVSYDILVPRKSGTLALTSDIPSLVVTSSPGSTAGTIYIVV